MSDLSAWLTTQIKDRGWSMNELARQADISQSFVSDVMSEKRFPTYNFCAAMARALNYPLDKLLRMADLLPNFPQYHEDPTLQELIQVAQALPPHEREELLEYTRWRLELHRRKKDQRS